MATFAVMGGNTVSNVIVADDKEKAETDLNVVLVEYTGENPAGIGWVLDQATGTFTAPVVVEPAPLGEEVAQNEVE